MAKDCKIIFNKNGKVIGVKDKAGNDSTLFKEIVKNPILTTKEAVEAYKNIYGEKLKDSVKFQILGERGVKNLDQAEEVTFRMDNLLVAKEMEQAGKTLQEIKLLTNWEKGLDNLWRYEVEDVRLKEVEIEVGEEYNIEDIIEESSILTAYPQFKKYKITFNENGRNSYRADTQTFEIDAKRVANSPIPTGRRSANIDEFFRTNVYRLQPNNSSVLEHELVHASQQYEGFYSGGSPDAIIAEANRISGVKTTDNEQVRYNKYQRALENQENLTQSERNALKALQKFTFGNSNALMEAYFNIAGEVEARTVEQRIGMSMKERRNRLLRDELNISEKDQIFLRTYLGTSMSLNSPQKAEREVINRLKQNGLANKIFEMNTQEINAKLEELGVDAETRKQISQFNLKRVSIYDYLVPVKVLDKIKEFDRNTPLRGEDYYNTLKEDIRKNGIRTPITVNKDGWKYLITEGNHRLQVAKELGIENIPVKIEYGKLGSINKDRAVELDETLDRYRVPTGTFIDNRDVQFQKTLNSLGINLTVNGFVYKNDIYLNTDQATNNTALHEFSHLYNSWLKQSRPELYNRGIELIKAELENENSEIKDIIDYVKTTQPNLKGEALEEEILTELTGRRGAELLEAQKAKKGGIIDWLKDVWNEIASMLGLSSMTPQQVANLTLGQYADAVGVDLLIGKPFKGQDGEVNFNRWKGENELVEGSEIQDVRTGQPIVAKVYHGTTNEFYEFDASVKGNIEGHLGKVNYFTSDIQDANQNYLSEGADITGRIDRRQDELEDSLQYNYPSAEVDGAVDFKEVVEEFNITEEEIEQLYPKGVPNVIYPQELSRFLAERELKGDTEQVLELYVKLNNPVVLGSGATWFDALEIDEVYLEEATQEIAEEYSITEQEAKDEYDWEIRDRAVEKQGDGNKVVEALERALDDNGYDSSQASDILGDNYYESEVDLQSLENQIRSVELYDNYEGELASSQVIADFFRNLGFDGVILTDVSERFKNMRLGDSTSHIHVFDEYNNQIKLADGSNVTFGETSDIRFQKAIEPILVYKTPKGEQYNSYKEALLNTQEGEIQAGVLDNEGKFQEFFSTNSNSNLNTHYGRINSLIRQGLLSGEKYTDAKGQEIYKTEGNSLAKKAINAEYVKEVVRKQAGIKGASVLENGDVILRDEVFTITDNKGEKVPFTNTFDFSKASDPIAVLVVQEMQIAGTNTQEVVLESENELQLKLMSFLKKMGIKTLDIASYVEMYSKKNGVPPSASALANIAESIIAFRDGMITVEDLAEETAHFIVAGTPMSEKENLLRNINKTQEWMEYSEHYREVYGQTLQGEELEMAVREEILGKVLANALQRQFIQEETHSDTQKSIVSRLLKIIENFFNRINSFFQDSFREELDNYTQSIYNNLMNETLELDKSGFKDYKFDMFSLGISKKSTTRDLYDNLSEAIEILRVQENNLAKNKGSLSKEQLKQAKEIVEKKDALELKKASAMVALVAENQVNHLERSINKNKGEFPFSQAENAVYNTFDTKTRIILAEVTARLDNKDKEDKKIIKQIEDTLSKFSALTGKIAEQENLAVDLLVKKVIAKHKLNEKQAQEFRDAVNTIQKDTAWMHANLGTLVNARNPLLNLAGDVINRTMLDSRETYLNNIKQYTNALEKAGVSAQELKQLNDNGYLLSDFDFKAYEEAEFEIKTAIYNKIKNSDLKVEEFKALEKEGLVLLKDEIDAKKLTNEEGREFSKTLKEETNKWRENYFTDEFLKKQEELYENIPLEAVEFHKRNRALRADVMANAYQEDGTTVLDSNDAHRIQQLNKERALNASPRDANGDLKYGLVETYSNGEYKYSLDENVVVSEEAKIAFGLQEISRINRESFEGSVNKEVPQKFFDILSGFDSVEEQLEFLFNNAYVGFPDEFWEGFGRNNPLSDRLIEEGAEDLAKEIRKQQQRISGIQKQNRHLNRPSETNVAEMTLEEKNTIKEAQEELEDLYRQARAILNDESVDVEELFEKTTNEAYKEEIEDLGIETLEEELDFIKKNVTTNNRKAIDKFVKIAEELKAGRLTEVTGMYADYLSVEMSKEEINQAILDFSKSRLLPYYKRTAPIGFEQLMSEVKSGEVSVEYFIKSDLVQVSPNFTFYETAVSDNVNPVFLENKKSGRPQIKRGLFESKKFKDTFGTVVDGRPSQNEKLWQAREATLNLQRETLKLYGLDGKHNLFLLPQIGKRGFRQIEDLIKKKDRGTVLEMVKDFVEFREDEQEYGKATGIIPQYYTRKLENQEDVTDELLYSYAMMAQQASLYSARVNNLGDMLSVEQALLKGKGFTGGKKAESTNTYKMFKSYMDYNFFGVKETFSYQVELPFGIKADLAALARRFHRWIQLVNLTGVIVPLTSMLQGSIVKRIETIVGETINPIASSLANKEFRKLAPASAGEILSINSKSKLNVLMESIGVYDLTQSRFENSNYNKFTRGVTKWASATHEMANFPIIPRVALTVMMDYRYVDGEILTFNKYKQRQQAKGEGTESWKNFDLFYEDIYVEDGVRKFDTKSIAKKLGVEEAEAESFIVEVNEGITNRTATAVQRIDSQIPSHEKSLAARHGIANFFLLHSNWLLLATQQRFKNKHLNLNTGEMEEGSYTSAWNVIKSLTQGFDRKSGQSYLKHVKKVWDESLTDETTRRNLIRTGTELAMVNTMLVASYLLSKALEDDDDPLYALQLADYMLYRVTNEQISGTVGLVAQYPKALESPIKGIDRLYDLKDIGDIFSGETVQRGTYAGMTNRERWISRNVAGIKEISKLSRIDKTSDTYRLFNKDNEMWTILAYNLLKEDK